MEQFEFDIAIVGGGHAGFEAAHCASQFKNLSVVIVTMPEVGLASAPCNPAVGGVGKGQVVRELDHLGGIMGKLADLSGIQFRTLNESKGYAVHSTRIQIDKEIYSKNAEKLAESIENLTVLKSKVIKTSKSNDIFQIIAEDYKILAKKVVFTVGTFLNGKLHYGLDSKEGGRHETRKTDGLNSIFKDIKVNPKRFKTGTPPRLDVDTIKFKDMEVQPSDSNVESMHVLHGTFQRFIEQKNCYLTYTNVESMTVIRENKEKSPMFNGNIKATGARYCPSIEDKAYRYPDKNIHHVFVEPEGLNLKTMYPSGISTSLPIEVQQKMVNTIVGLEEAKILVPGYAVEYDVVDTTQLDSTLQLIDLPGLYFAGQVNGTSGYEEAAGQGLIAGFNAALSILGREPLVLSRNDSYIGVMIEDLVSNLRDEPYRLFTARSENRLYIREDNTALRMAKYRRSLGLYNQIDHYIDSFEESFKCYMDLLGKTLVDTRDMFYVEQNIKFDKKVSLIEVLKLSHINPIEFLQRYFAYNSLEIDYRLIKCLAISVKYSGYIAKSDEVNQKTIKLDDKPIDWSKLVSSENISFECKQRITAIKPSTFGQLRRIEGIRQATLSAVAGQYY